MKPEVWSDVGVHGYSSHVNQSGELNGAESVEGRHHGRAGVQQVSSAP